MFFFNCIGIHLHLLKLVISNSVHLQFMYLEYIKIEIVRVHEIAYVFGGGSEKMSVFFLFSIAKFCQSLA